MGEVLTGHRASERRTDALAIKDLPDGREATVYWLATGTVRLVVGEPDAPFYDDAW